MPQCPQCGEPSPDHARFCTVCGTMLETSRAAPDPLIGLVIADRFRILRRIGEGGMGRVYLGQQQMGTVTRAVAIKVLPTSTANPLAVARFYRECELVVQLSHPNTIRFYDFGQVQIPLGNGRVDTRLYIAMEYIEGRTLSAAIAEGPLPLEVVDRLVRQIGGSLTEAHRRGIVHRDLKPDNILLAHHEGEGEVAKVCDFGIAKKATGGGPEITVQGTIVGTPAYMSPEQIKGLPVDERSDVYALALITYEMLTGERPFLARTPVEWASAHLSDPPRSFDEFPSTRSLPDERRKAILRALEKDPTQRTPTVRAFVEEFCGADSGRQPSGRPDGDPSPERPSHAAWLVPMLAGVALLGGGVTIVIAVARGTATRHDEPVDTVSISAAPDPPRDAGVDVGDPIVPREWVTILHYEDRTENATAALGPPDGRCARLQPRGTITLELTPGVRIVTDGTEAPDMSIEIGASQSGPYRVDVGVERHRFTTIARGLVASALLDVDQYGIQRFRYVRIKNREKQGTVCIDAVGAFRRERP